MYAIRNGFETMRATGFFKLYSCTARTLVRWKASFGRLPTEIFEVDAA